MKPHVRCFSLCLIVSAVAFLFTALPAWADTTAMVSLSVSGTQGNEGSALNGFNGDWTRPSTSRDGTQVAFVSTANNLIGAGADTNGVMDVFVRDRRQNTTIRASVWAIRNNTTVIQGNRDSNGPSISADGRFVAFASQSTNWVAGAWGQQNIFLYDRDADGNGKFDEPGGVATSLVDIGIDGLPANLISSSAAVSAFGEYVSFSSRGTNLVPSDTNGAPDCFVRTMSTGQVEMVSVAEDGTHDGFSTYSSLSDDGRFVAFQTGDRLLPEDVNDEYDIYVRDRLLGTLSLISVSSGGILGNGSSCSPYISGNGRFVVFYSTADNLVPGDTNLCADVFIHDRDTDADGIFDEPGTIKTVRVSVTSAGAQGTFASISEPTVSSDGRFVAFESIADLTGNGGYGGPYHVYLHDRDADNDGIMDEPGAIQITQVDKSSTGVNSNGQSSGSSISADGKVIAFQSLATNLVTDPNGFSDVFVRLRAGIAIVVATFDYVNDTLTMAATSPLGASDALVVVGFGPMTWKSKNVRWEGTYTKVSTAPYLLTVTGKSGSAIIQ